MKPAANNKETMKKQNRSQVLSLISRSPVSRSGLAKETGLTLPAIGSIVNELVQVGLVRETGKSEGETVIGRKPVFLDIVPDWKSIVAISIDHEGFELGLVDCKGAPFGEIVHLPYVSDTAAALDSIAAAAQNLVSRASLPKEQILGAGVIAPGPVDATAGRILNPPSFEAWHNLNLRDELERRFPYPVYVQHNSGALALAESRMGAGLQYHNFALLIINAGIGLGLVLNDQVYTGANGLGCEIAHTSIDLNGRLCSCGNRGCLELYASTSAVLYDTTRVRPEIQSWEQLVDNAYTGDSFCIGMLDQQAKYLAHSIINLNNLLELEAVVLTGMAAYRGELLLEKLRTHVQQNVLSKSNRTLAVELSPIQKNPMIIAAGSVLINALLQDDLFHRSNQAKAGNP